MQSRFNAPVWAFLVVLAAYVPQFFPSIITWPPVGVLLFVALVLTIVGVSQQRILGSAIMVLILLVAGPMQWFLVPFMHAAAFGHNQQQASTVAQLSIGDEPVAQNAPKGINGVALSQQAAIRKYPSLAIRDSPLNGAFVARYKLWVRRNDPRLLQSNWPEVLADDCSANP